jgi:hypothetical protein
LQSQKNFTLKLYAQKSEKIQDDDDVDDDDVGTLLVAGEEDGSSKDGLGNIDGLKIRPYDLLKIFLVPYHKNWNNTCK